MSVVAEILFTKTLFKQTLLHLIMLSFLPFPGTEAWAIVNLRDDLELEDFVQSQFVLRTPQSQDAHPAVQRNTVQPENTWNFISVRATGYVKTLALGLDAPAPDSPIRAMDFTRARLMLEGDISSWIRWTVHYEHFGVINANSGSNANLSSGDRSSQTQRASLLPLDWTVKHSGSFLWRHELDRLNVRFRLPAADIVVGRQAISWGVGRLWTPADLFVSFSPVEIDQDFKPGVDAVHMKFPFGNFSQIEVVYAALEEDFRTHTIGLRGQTSIQDFDVGLMAGKSYRDFVIGPFFDGEVRGAGIRAEFTLTQNTAGRLDERRTFVRSVTSVDYRFANGVYGLLEYYYNGFGKTDAASYSRLFPSQRLTRGEIFNLGRHYLGAIFEYEFHPLVRGSLFSQWNMLDHSGLVGPLLSVSLSDEADVRLGTYLPWGADLNGVQTRSEFGLYPYIYYLQLRLYF